MARRQGIEISEGWGGKYYVGSRDELIAEGLVEPEWFPGEPGQRKTSGWDPEHRINVSTYGNRFRVTVPYTEQEKKENAEHEAREKREREAEVIKEAQAEEDKEMANMPSSAEDYRAYIERTVENLFNMMGNFLMGSVPGGYRFTEEDVLVFYELHGNMLDLVRDGRVIFDKPARDRDTAEIRVKTAKANAPLQEFLRQIISDGVSHE